MKTAHKIFLAKLAYHVVMVFRSLVGKGPIALVQRRGVNWELDLREGIDLAIFLQGQFEPQTAKALSRLVHPGNTVVDIGANIGAHTLALANYVGEHGKVIAFEPTQYAYQKLLRNISLNAELKSRIVPEQIMLGQENQVQCQTSVYSSWRVVGDAERHPKHLGELKTTEGASMWRLDSYLDEKQYPRIDLIKLDVDGYECEVLNGARGRLERDRPIICFELAPYVLNERGNSLKELVDILREYNYRIMRESSLQALPLDSTALTQLIPDGVTINALAFPADYPGQASAATAG